MKLYNVPKNSRIMLDNGQELNFFHVDGMYSYCEFDDKAPVYLVAWADVEVVKPISQGHE